MEKRTARLLVLSLSFCLPLFAGDKRDLAERYKGKYLLVLREGLAVGVCEGSPGVPAGNALDVKISGDSVEFGQQAGAGTGITGCGEIIPEPLHKGEIVFAKYTWFRRLKGGYFTITVLTVTAHQVKGGERASRHERLKYGKADLIFETSDAKDYDAVAALVEKWLRPFDTRSEAAQSGNTASGIYVKEVKLGMSFAEVEAALGPPQTRADLGDKVLYKYKDMTVEFHDGKVTDVK
ncbi:MAG: hypothetical protein ABSH52_32205 [Terriglobia bacterium]|jgi:hypothetical protein